MSYAAEPGEDEESLPETYDAEALDRYWAQRPFTVVARRVLVAREFLPFLAKLLIEWRILGTLECEEVCKERASRFREILTSLGPAFIKAGQALSIRPDLLPEVALKELQRLCDDCPAFPWTIAEATLGAELGDDIRDLFKDLPAEPQPVAAASLGQVYRWTRSSDGCVVAVKVQRPGMRYAVALDVYTIRGIAKIMRFFVQTFTQARIDHVALVDAWAAGTYAELDYRGEARNQEHFREEMAKRMPDRLYVPKVYHEMTTRRVLVTEWVEGPRLADCEPEVVRKLVPVGVECFLAQLLEMGVFHSDPHPGNMLVNDGRLVLIDFGLVANIGKISMDSIALACVHLISGDFENLFDDLIMMELLPKDANREEILPALSSVLQQGMRAGGDIRRRAKNFQGISDDLNKVFFEMPFQVPDYFALITRALAVLEGIALVGDSEFDIFWAAYPFALSKAAQLLGPRRAAGLLSAATALAAQQMSAEDRFAAWQIKPGRTSADGGVAAEAAAIPSGAVAA